MAYNFDTPRWIRIGKALYYLFFRFLYKKQNIPKILIIRTDGRGDLLLFSGAFKEIKGIYAGREIEIVVLKGREEIIEFCPYVDHIHVFPVQGTSRIKLLLMRTFFFARLYVSNYETIIQPMPHSDKIAFQLIISLRAKRKIGFTGNLANQTSDMRELLKKALDEVVEPPRKHKWAHQLEYTKKICKVLGCDISENGNSLWPEIYLSEEDFKWWRKICLDESLDSFVKIVVSPGSATTTLKIWPIEGYVKLARKMAKEYQLPIAFVLIGSRNEKELIAGLENQLSVLDGIRIINLCGRTNLRQAAGVIKGCDLYLGLDSFALHAAIAFGIRTVGIIGGGHKDSYYLWGDTRKNKGVFKETECWGCYWQCNQITAKCVNGISVDDVWNSVDYQLQMLTSKRYPAKTPHGSPS